MILGLHVSIAGSIDKSVDRAVALNCKTFQIFTRNPRDWQFQDLKHEDTNLFKKKCKDNDIKFPIAHMPYLPNLASPKDEIYDKSTKTLTDELNRCHSLGIPYLVTHLGSHLGKGTMYGINRVIDACNIALSNNKKSMILLENTAGTKNSIGSTFENLKYILDNTDDKKVGICFDTAHAFAAGYDLRSNEDVKRTMDLFDDIIGLEKIKVIHLNDSKASFNSHSDRHQHISLGYIGEHGFKAILKHKITKTCPLILETPVDSIRDDVGNLRKVKEIKDEN
jgi:deoxyribonuclease-4